MIWTYELYNHEYWSYQLISGDITIWQELENGNYSQYLTLAVL